MPGGDQLEPREIITTTEASKRLGDTGRTDAVGDVHYPSKLLERVEEFL